MSKVVIRHLGAGRYAVVDYKKEKGYMIKPKSLCELARIIYSFTKEGKTVELLWEPAVGSKAHPALSGVLNPCGLRHLALKSK